jgi:hypothetical protein
MRWFTRKATTTDVFCAVKALERWLMATAQEFRDAFIELRATNAKILADIQRVLDAQDGGGMSAAEETELLAELQTIVDEAKAIDAVVPEPGT